MGVRFDTVKIDRMVLDHAGNPRHNPLQDEPAAIEALYRPFKVLPLAKHIAEHGLDPTRVLAVMEHPKLRRYFVSLEGNRRVCALKLLRDPERAPDPRSQRDMQRVVAGAVHRPTELRVAIFPDRGAAREWLKLTHRRSRTGVGTLDWTVEQNERFDAQEPGVRNPNSQAVALLDYAVQEGLLSEAERAKIQVTNVTRYLTTPDVRRALGLHNGRDLMRNAPAEEFDRAVRRFLRDHLPDGKKPPALTSRTHLKAQDRQAYAVQISKDGDGVSTRLPSPELARPGQVTKAPPARSSRHPHHRPFVVPASFKLQTKDPILRRIFGELQRIDPEPDGFPFAANYLLRAFIERVTVGYAERHRLGHHGELHAVVQRCADHLKGQGVEDKVLKPLRTHASEVHHFSSVHTLGAAVHGNTIPKDKTMKDIWDGLEPPLLAMLGRM